LTLDDLGPWLAENPEVLIVTDVKERNIEGLARLAQAYPQQLYRIVPQIYDPDELAAVRDLGFKDIVFTLYRSDLGDDAVVEFASANRLFGVTMEIQRALSTDLPARLAAANVAVFVHTVNDHRTFQELRDRGVVGIYTDWLSPTDTRMPTRPGLWTVETSGVEPMGSRAIAFVPSKMDGLAISLVFSNGGTAPEPIRVTVMDASGNALGSAEVELQAGEERRLNAVDIFPPSVDHGWLRVEAADDVQATSRWVFRDNPETLRAVESISCSEFVARGPGTGTSGLLVALVNPTNSMQAYVLRRRIGDGLVDEDIVELNPDHQLIRVYRSGTDEDIELQVTGGQMVPFTLRWDPLVRFIE
jgi:hypothetical protein